MSLKQSPPVYTSSIDGANLELIVDDEGIEIGCESIHRDHIPDIVEFLKIAQAWIDENAPKA